MTSQTLSDDVHPVVNFGRRRSTRYRDLGMSRRSDSEKSLFEFFNDDFVGGTNKKTRHNAGNDNIDGNLENLPSFLKEMKEKNAKSSGDVVASKKNRSTVSSPNIEENKSLTSAIQCDNSSNTKEIHVGNTNEAEKRTYDRNNKTPSNFENTTLKSPKRLEEYESDPKDKEQSEEAKHYKGSVSGTEELITEERMPSPMSRCDNMSEGKQSVDEIIDEKGLIDIDDNLSILSLEDNPHNTCNAIKDIKNSRSVSQSSNLSNGSGDGKRSVYKSPTVGLTEGNHLLHLESTRNSVDNDRGPQNVMSFTGRSDSCASSAESVGSVSGSNSNTSVEEDIDEKYNPTNDHEEDIEDDYTPIPDTPKEEYSDLKINDISDKNANDAKEVIEMRSNANSTDIRRDDKKEEVQNSDSMVDTAIQNAIQNFHTQGIDSQISVSKEETAKIAAHENNQSNPHTDGVKQKPLIQNENQTSNDGKPTKKKAGDKPRKQDLPKSKRNDNSNSRRRTNPIPKRQPKAYSTSDSFMSGSESLVNIETMHQSDLSMYHSEFDNLMEQLRSNKEKSSPQSPLRKQSSADLQRRSLDSSLKSSPYGNYTSVFSSSLNQSVSTRNSFPDCGTVKLPVIDNRTRVLLTQTQTESSFSDESVNSRNRERDLESEQRERVLEAENGLKKSERCSHRRATHNAWETYAHPVTHPLGNVGAGVPVPLKSEAIYRNGQLEVSVTDESQRLSDNVNMKITVVHKNMTVPRGMIVRPRRRYNRLPKLNFGVNRDIVKQRAMYPPFNTYVDPEASGRFKNSFGMRTTEHILLMAFLCPSRVGRNVKTRTKKDKPFGFPGRITGSDSVDTLVRVGLEKQHGLPPESRVKITHNFNKSADNEITVKRGETVHILYEDHDWAYVIKRTGQEGFVPLRYCSSPESESDAGSSAFERSSYHHDQLTNDIFDNDSVFTETPGTTGQLSREEINDRIFQPIYPQQNGTMSAFSNQNTAEQPATDSNNQDVRPFRKASHGQFIVLFDFVALDENDISVERAELVDVLNIEDPDWSWVRKYDSQEGFVPKAYICPIEPMKAAQDKAEANAKQRRLGVQLPSRTYPYTHTMVSRISPHSHNGNRDSPASSRTTPDSQTLSFSPQSTGQHTVTAKDNKTYTSTAWDDYQRHRESRITPPSNVADSDRRRVPVVLNEESVIGCLPNGNVWALNNDNDPNGDIKHNAVHASSSDYRQNATDTLRSAQNRQEINGNHRFETHQNDKVFNNQYKQHQHMTILPNFSNVDNEYRQNQFNLQQNSQGQRSHVLQNNVETRHEDPSPRPPSYHEATRSDSSDTSATKSSQMSTNDVFYSNRQNVLHSNELQQNVNGPSSHSIILKLWQSNGDEKHMLNDIKVPKEVKHNINHENFTSNSNETRPKDITAHFPNTARPSSADIVSHNLNAMHPPNATIRFADIRRPNTSGSANFNLFPLPSKETNGFAHKRRPLSADSETRSNPIPLPPRDFKGLSNQVRHSTAGENRLNAISPTMTAKHITPSSSIDSANHSENVTYKAETCTTMSSNDNQPTMKNNNGTALHSIMVKDAKAIFENMSIKELPPPKLPPRTSPSHKSQTDEVVDKPPKLPPRLYQKDLERVPPVDFNSNNNSDDVNEFVVIYDYTAQHALDDLTVGRGELVYADSKSLAANKDWLWVYSKKARKYGYVPKSYVKTPLQTAL